MQVAHHIYDARTHSELGSEDGDQVVMSVRGSEDSAQSSSSEVFAQARAYAELFLTEVGTGATPSGTSLEEPGLSRHSHSGDVSRLSGSGYDDELRRPKPRSLPIIEANSNNLSRHIHKKTAQITKLAHEERR